MISTNRIRGILLEPRREWQAIDAETTTPAALYSQWIAPLAAIGPIASFIGLSFVGFTMPFGGGRVVVPVTTGLAGAIVRYVGALVGVYILALVIDTLAPRFGGQSSRIQALKVAAYSSTAAWLAGIFGIIPALGILGLLGLYSFYLLYLGLPVLMKTPADRAVPYTIVVVVVAIVIFICLGLVSSLVLRMGGAGYPAGLPR
ncbi:MAG TPA: Yip1 family protein [Thermoanaerobaculia bacterium]|nr:Yip1 family protein [Thermoanaerobaculia bacterium]